jgi:hypothetical protein
MSLREPYEPGKNLHFAKADDHAPMMWATHPSNREREEHAKREYVPHVFDQRPAWMLVDRRTELARELTLSAYEHVLSVTVQAQDCRSAREIDAAARAEEEEQRQADHYHGLYENRVIEPGRLDAVIAKLDSEPVELTALRSKVATWTGERLASFAREHRETQAAISLLGAIDDGQLDPGASFELRGEHHPTSAAARMLSEEQARLEQQRKRLRRIDKTVFSYFYLKTAHDPALREELVVRYRFLLGVQKHIVPLNGLEERINAVMSLIGSGRELGDAEVHAILAAFADAHAALRRALSRARKLQIPKLSHLEQAPSVAAFVLAEPLVEPPALPLAGEWIGSFLRQYGQTLERLRRLHFKNLGVLLRLQESLDEKLYAAKTARPACDRCGTRNSSDSRFCKQCGAELASR